MYNEKIKNRYIAEKETEVILPNNYLIIQFNRVSEMEEELNKDVSNFTTYEIIEYYKISGFSSLESLQVLNSQFNMYTQWCLQENLVKDNQNHFLEISKDTLNSCVNKAIFDKKIINRDTVLKWVNEIPNPKDQFILLSLFEYGKSKNFLDIINVELSDIVGNTLKLQDGRVVKISDKLKQIASYSYYEKTYYSISGKGVKKMPLIDNGNKVIKDYPNARKDVSEFQLGRKIYNSITRSLDYVGVLEWCSANSVTESGKLHMIKERSKELNKTPMQYLYSDNIAEVEKQYGCNIVKSVYSIKYKEYLE